VRLVAAQSGHRATKPNKICRIEIKDQQLEE